MERSTAASDSLESPSGRRGTPIANVALPRALSTIPLPAPDPHAARTVAASRWQRRGRSVSASSRTPSSNGWKVSCAMPPPYWRRGNSRIPPSCCGGLLRFSSRISCCLIERVHVAVTTSGKVGDAIERVAGRREPWPSPRPRKARSPGAKHRGLPANRRKRRSRATRRSLPSRRSATLRRRPRARRGGSASRCLRRPRFLAPCCSRSCATSLARSPSLSAFADRIAAGEREQRLDCRAPTRSARWGNRSTR